MHRSQPAGRVDAALVLLGDRGRLGARGLIGLLSISYGDTRGVQAALWTHDTGGSLGLSPVERSLGVAGGSRGRLDLCFGCLALLLGGTRLKLGQRRLLLAECCLRLCELLALVAIVQACQHIASTDCLPDLDWDLRDAATDSEVERLGGGGGNRSRCRNAQGDRTHRRSNGRIGRPGGRGL